jgi:diguanylate cyclase (GGDEF)-like protein
MNQTMAKPKTTVGIDFKTEGRDVEVKLLRSLALGGKRSVEIQLLLDSQVGGRADYQALSLLLADLSVPQERARITFEKLREHQQRLKESLGRAVGIKTAAMDYLENLERALNLKDDEQALTYSQLAQIAFQDHLTGLSNYRYFMRRFQEEIKRADRYRHLLSVLMLDLDHFKRFNDTFGHPAGNKALETVASILRSQVRETDLVGRYGGEEFAIILPETTKYEAAELCNRIRMRVEGTTIDLPDASPQRVTVSGGLATYPRDARSAEALLASADEALYASKKAGRNRVSTFTPASIAQFIYVPENPNSTHAISVVGDFNGWNKYADTLQRTGDRFTLSIPLAPGRYSYKFVINNEWYIFDPRSSEFAHDGYGGKNSLLVVK